MSDALIAIARLEAIVRKVSAPLSDELNDALERVREPIERNTEENRRLAHAQADALIHSAEIITELKEARDEMARLRLKAEQASMAKSAFLANMSHEIRTPLTAILGFTQLLISGDDEDRDVRSEYLQTIDSKSRHLLNLLNDILNLSRIEVEESAMEAAPFDPALVIGELVSAFRDKARDKGLEIFGLPAETKLPHLRGDSARFRHVLSNLIDNAVKFSDRGEVRVTARIDSDPPNSRLIVEISDTGIGIPREKLEDIFRPFVQVDESVTRRYGGTGLGLAIGKRIALALGGDLTAVSTEGDGSTFQLQIAADVIEPHNQAALRGTVSSDEFGKPDRLDDLRILLVDDSRTNRKLLSVILSRAGALVTPAEDGQQAVERATAESYDVILMDIEMPVMDGLKATVVLREMGITSPIIALTGSTREKDRRRCMAAGCSGFLSKPVSIDDLVAAITEACLVPSGNAREGSQRQTHPTTNATHAPTAPNVPVALPTLVAPPIQTASPAPTGTASPIISTLPTDDEDFREIVREFVDTLCQKLEIMRRVLAEKDLEELARLAHWLKGSGGTAGFADFTKPAANLEHLAKEHRYDQLEAALSELDALTQRIVVPEKIEAPS